MLGRRRPALTEAELRRWASSLAEREDKLAADQAEFAMRAERTVDETADEIVRALETIRLWFPAGVLIAPDGYQHPGSTRRLH